MDQPVAPPPPDVRLGLDPAGLAALAQRVFAARLAEPDLDHLELDLPSVDDALRDLRARVADGAGTTFATLVDHCRRSSEVIAYFLALLELARWGVVDVAQPDWLSEIEILYRHDPRADELTSEWSR
jgi:chromatin segregation and condensation protein Rec8/ScpA/Scc1 (kleisin family)